MKSRADSESTGCENTTRRSGIWYNARQMKCRVTIDGALPRRLGINRAALREAAELFAERSAARADVPFREVTVVLQGDARSSEVHRAINGVDGATDVVTQRYDPMPGEASGVYGELYVNVDQAVRAAPRRRGWNAAKELLLYVAHGMDHLSGADDLTPEGYSRMRRRELGWLACLSRLRLRSTAALGGCRRRGNNGIIRA